MTSKPPGSPRIVSLVPSWTETLLSCNIELVGRTRYCTVPEPLVTAIPTVGGTKSVNWERIQKLEPDLLILDKEENPKSFAEKAPCEYWASHIQNIRDLQPALLELSVKLKNLELKKLSEEWGRVQSRSLDFDVNNPPGLLSWVKPPVSPPKEIVYLIWKNPWMAISKNTFIGSMLNQLGGGNFLSSWPQKYPEISLSEFNRKDTLVLLSSEPYPFEDNHEDFKQFECSSALIDGSVYSWFGIRALRFLQGRK